MILTTTNEIWEIFINIHVVKKLFCEKILKKLKSEKCTVAVKVIICNRGWMRKKRFLSTQNFNHIRWNLGNLNHKLSRKKLTS